MRSARTARRAWQRARPLYARGRTALNQVLVERRLGIETSAPATLRDLRIEAPGRVGYEPSGWLDLPRVLRRRDVGPDDVFIDLGCGKGRVLLQAARLPFKRVVGVELSLELADVARANVQSCARRLECPDLEIVAHDVTTYDVPDDVTVVYMYNAFRGHILQGALDRLVESHRRNPRRMRLIYRTPQEHDRVVASGFVPTRIARGLRPSREWSRKMAIRMYELS